MLTVTELSESTAPGASPSPLVEVRNLVKHFRLRHRGLRFGQHAVVRAVDDVTLSIDRGRTFGLVGESGSGKTTLGRLLLQLERPTSGEIFFDGRDWLANRGEQLRRERSDVQAIFQDPLGSLDPRYRVVDAIAEAIAAHEPQTTKGERRDRAIELLARVGLNSGIARRYPHELSGGQRQRVTIARAISVNPKFLICDEAVSALDVSVQAQVVNLLVDLQAELGVSYLFISHGLATVWHVADEIGVMYLGRLVERAPAEEIFTRPAHPYTAALLAASPKPDPTMRPDELLRGEIPSATELPSGCRFRLRCPRAAELCAEVEPQLTDLGTGHEVACHFPETVPLGLPEVRATSSSVRSS